jgi:membrane associated rhomboid family serine protease
MSSRTRAHVGLTSGAAFLPPVGLYSGHREALQPRRSAARPSGLRVAALPLASGSGGDRWVGCGGAGRAGGGGRGGGRDDGSGARWNLAAAPLILGSVALRRHAPVRRSFSGGDGGGGDASTLLSILRTLRVSHFLLAVNVAAFLLQGAVGSRLLMFGAKVNTEIAAGQWYRLVSPMFLHASASHLLVNAFSLYSMGPSVESWFGRGRFLALYLFSGVSGNLLSFLCTPTPSVGASGAIFGLVGATAVLLARHRRILGPRSGKGLNSLAYITLVNFGMGMSPGTRIDNFGHLGGLLGGVIFAYLAGPRLVEARGVGGKRVLVDLPLIEVALTKSKIPFSMFIARVRSLKTALGKRRRRR